METLENGLIVDFKNSNIYAVEAFIKNSEYYGYEIEGSKYLFPSPKSEYDILEQELVDAFVSWEINSFTFDGI